MSFLPKNYTLPTSSSGGNYTKLLKGKTTIRIIGDAIIGWLGWTDENGKRSPHRSKEQPPVGKFEERAKHIWAFPVYNHDTNSVQILEIAQRGIQDALKELYEDKNWGCPKKYDVVIKRDGNGLETSYSVMPVMPTDLDDDAITMIKAKLPTINIDALYEGGDPFAESTDTTDEEPF